MDKTKQNLNLLLKQSKRLIDIIAIIGSSLEYNLNPSRESFDLLSRLADELSKQTKNFLDDDPITLDE